MHTLSFSVNNFLKSPPGTQVGHKLHLYWHSAFSLTFAQADNAVIGSHFKLLFDMLDTWVCPVSSCTALFLQKRLLFLHPLLVCALRKLHSGTWFLPAQRQNHSQKISLSTTRFLFSRQVCIFMGLTSDVAFLKLGVDKKNSLIMSRM